MTEQTDTPTDQSIDANHIAIIGIAGRFPESPNIEAFWQNLHDGVDCLVTASDEELDELGIPQHLYRRPGFVRRGTRLPHADCFDARFFGFTPREAELMDPQSRIFLETCYHAIENAGYNPYGIEVPTGVFAGSNPNDYASLLGVADPSDSLSAFNQLIGSDKDFLTTRVSHRLNLKGPSMDIQTACSTSLVAVHMAVQSLLNYECSMCLAGGVTVNFRQGVGYFYQDGMILSPEGKCRAFDANASGTTLGQGCGVVLLKRLADAIEDKDHIYAVVRATALNNDGSDKISYTAPSENGQAEAIAIAHELAEIDSDSIGYIEAHGTGTKLGDPIEIAALSRAFAAGTERKQYCGIGSAKTNFGHTDAAAGITGFLKTALSLYHAKIVPSLHCNTPNPDIEFENTPFYVSSELRDWPQNNLPRRAGVSAFGIGGTNAHAVLEEAPLREQGEDVTGFQLLPLSAKSETSVSDLSNAINGLLQAPNTTRLGDIAHTLRYGRPEFKHRRMLIVKGDGSEQNIHEVSGKVKNESAQSVWMFSGQGAQYFAMGRDLYATYSVFARTLDKCADAFMPLIGADLRTLLFDEPGEQASETLKQTQFTQPALFSIEVALAHLLNSWGFKPDAVVGHSIGEFAAAVVAGVISLDDAITVVAKRGQLMQAMTEGDMLSVAANVNELGDLPAGVSLAADNATGLCVVAGPAPTIAAYAKQLEERQISTQLLQTSHAFHSSMMQSAADQFAVVMQSVSLHPPEIPMSCNITGEWLSSEEAANPGRWAKQIVSPVRFAKCVETTAALGKAAYLELGPGRTLATLARRNDAIDADVTVVPTMPPPADEPVAGAEFLLESMAKLWCSGLPIDWSAMYSDQDFHRIPLPAYPFERIRHWAPSHKHVLALPQLGEIKESSEPSKRLPIEQWLYSPSWQRLSIEHSPREETNGARILLLPDTDLGHALGEALSRLGAVLTLFASAGELQPLATNSYALNPNDEQTLKEVFDAFLEQHSVTHVVHAWHMQEATELELERSLDLGIHSAHACARVLAKAATQTPIQLDFLTIGAQQVLGAERVNPAASALLGPAKVIPLEYPGLSCRHIDIEADVAVPTLTELLNSEGADQTLALRGSYCWQYRVALTEIASSNPSPLKPSGCYMIVGGLGGVGLSIAEYLVDAFDTRLVLTSRSGRPTADDEHSETYHRLQVLERIEDKAAGVRVLAADAGSLNSMREAVNQAEREFGRIDGVIVAAGVADQAGAIHRRSREQATEAIAAKVHGSQVLLELFADKNLDFLLLSSSIASMLYHNRFAQVGYVTANSYVEAFAIYARQRGINAITVAWDDWMEIGMSVRAAASFSETYGSEVSLVDELHSFTPAEGVELFKSALRSNEPVLYVSTTDLNRRMRHDVDVVSPFLQQALGNDSEEPGGDLSASSSEQLLSKIWSELLGFEEFEAQDDFFDLGGDSLQVARMADRLTRSLGVDVPLNTVFDTPVLSELAQKLDELRGQGTESSEREALSGKVALGPAQQRFMLRPNTEHNHFNISAVLRASAHISAEILQESLVKLVEHHDSLRFRLENREGALTQYALNPNAVNVDLQVTEVETLNAEEVRKIGEKMQTSLDLFAGPVLKASLLQAANGEQRVLLVVHHMVADRISLFLLLDGLSSLYENLRAGERAALPNRTASYAQWLDAQETVVASNTSVLQAWLDRDWNNVGRLLADDDSQHRKNTNGAVKWQTTRLERDVTGQLLRHTSVRVDELLPLALADAVRVLQGTSDVLIDLLGHGRRLASGVDVSRTMGFFLNYGPIVLGAAGKPIADRLDELRVQQQDAWQCEAARFLHPDASFRDQLQQLPRAQVLFNYVGREISAEDEAFFELVAEESAGQDVDSGSQRDHLLAVRASVVDDELELTCVYPGELFATDAIATMMDKFTVQIRALLKEVG